MPAEKWFASTFSFIPWIGGGTSPVPNYFIGGLILAIMILPIVSAISREVIATVSSEHKEAALALGATRWEMIRIAVLPYSRPGITGGAMLGMGRAIGETIAVVLVIGNAPTIGQPPVRPGLHAGRGDRQRVRRVDGDPHLGAVRGRVGAVRAHADREHHRALVHLPGLARHQGNGRHRHDDRLRPGEREMSTTAIPQISARRRRTDKVMRGSLFAATMVALIPLILIIYYLLRKGLSAWTQSGFFTTDPTGSFFGSPGGIRSAILGSLEIVALATLISIPIGIGVALYLTEYGKQSWFANTVRYFVDVMTGVPSIMFGLFVYIVLVTGRFGGSGFAGLEGGGGGVAADASDRHPLVRGRAAAGAEQPSRGRAGAGRPKVARRLPGRPADRGPRPPHRLAACHRSRYGRDRSAAVHRLDRFRVDIQPRPQMNTMPGSDLSGHHLAA